MSNRITIKCFESRRQQDKRSKVECQFTISTEDEYDPPGSEIQFRIQAAAAACKEIIQHSRQTALSAPSSSDSEENFPEAFNNHQATTDIPEESYDDNAFVGTHPDHSCEPISRQDVPSTPLNLFGSKNESTPTVISTLSSSASKQVPQPESDLGESKSLATAAQLRAIDRLSARNEYDTGELCQQLFGFPETTDLFQEQASQLIRELQKNHPAA